MHPSPFLRAIHAPPRVPSATMKYSFACCVWLGALGCAGTAPSPVPPATRPAAAAADSDVDIDATVATAKATALDDAERACSDLARIAAKHPDELALLDALVVIAAAHGQLPLALARLHDHDDAAWVWYRGRAHYLLAETLRVPGPTADAFARSLAELDAALACFAAATRSRAEYAESSACWRAMCLGKKGNLAFLAGDDAHAEAWLLQAVTERPDQLTTDLGSGETIKLGLLRLGDRVMRDFARTERIFRTAAEAVGTDLDLLNNAAVYARDLGTRLERKGETAAARAMFTRSHATYLRAVDLAPHDVRLRNDAALVAIHHLGTDRERSRSLLTSAIADGAARLRDDTSIDARARAELEEAVGDCHENLALWHLQAGDAPAARAAAARSLQFPPYERRAGARRHLEAASKLAGGT